jgi:hypothetical protein
MKEKIRGFYASRISAMSELLKQGFSTVHDLAPTIIFLYRLSDRRHVNDLLKLHGNLLKMLLTYYRKHTTQ